MSLRLKGLTIFVGGPIQHALKARALDEGLKGHLATAISLLEAYGAQVLSAHRAEKFGADTHLFTPDEVSRRDRAWMEQCDIFVAVLPMHPLDGTLLRTDGTHIELGWASALRRPIVLVTAMPIDASASHLLKGLATVAQVEHVAIDAFEREPAVLAQVLALIAERDAQAA
ncbi:Nucleoside 2-deoxyribosyltransferase [Bordetella ansorpii]|uniref:Nucleoside 2-deoxyribosyltransferase n=1 Tax=Bordetella ansorpii TaxID=288768 RepID=A0A157QMK2_9BORD|nr:nucleoside 2-deoxyribosyltransferase [Bordetella ansorpii]SAI46987.1 Nucleoside 2-deoxyribosyltransferase [Bordetella ansorpii]